jgi:hypothetical protein
MGLYLITIKQKGLGAELPNLVFSRFFGIIFV